MNSNAPRRRLSRFAIGVVAVSVLSLGILSTSASAQQLRPYLYSSLFFDGSGSTAGTFSSTIDRIAHDDQSERLYVLDPGKGGGVLSRFSQSGVPKPFSDPSLAGASSIVIGPTGGTPAIAVDNTSNASQGNVYVISQIETTLFGFDPSGAPLPGFPLENLSNPCGVAVDPQGDVWVSELTATPMALREYTSGGVSTGKTFPEPNNPCNTEIDTDGNFYIAQNNGKTRKYSPTGAFLYDLNTIRTDDIAIDRSNNDVFIVENQTTIKRFNSKGAPQGQFGQAEGSYLGLQNARGVAVDPGSHEVWVSNRRSYSGVRRVERFTRGAAITVPTVLTEKVVQPTVGTAVVEGIVNPDGVATTACKIQWGTTAAFSNSVPCKVGGVDTEVLTGSSNQAVNRELTGLAEGTLYYARVSAKNANNQEMSGGTITFRASSKAALSNETLSEVNADSAAIGAEVDPNGGTTRYYIQYGPDTLYGSRFPAAPEELPVNSLIAPANVNTTLPNLTAGTEYHYRLVVTNDAGTTLGPDHVFKTFSPAPGTDPCPNAQVRQQTESSLLLDCRAYELVSAANTGGYDVESDLIPGQAPLIARPNADDRLLYSVHAGSVPGVEGNPTNFGRDPYVADRGPNGWSTRYVGLPANGMAQKGPFASPLLGTDGRLNVFAFGGQDICDPCFADESTNVPLRLSNESLVKGMAGSSNPAADPTGYVAQPFSDDGSHFVFGSTAQFEPAGNSGTVSIYDRNLLSSTTQVVSTLPGGATMTGEVGELGISETGTRIVVATKVSTDAAGNAYWHPYMHIGNTSSSVDLAPGATSGVLYAGMTSDGTKVFYTTTDKLLGADTDEGADLYEAAVGGGGTLTLKLLSTGTPPPVGDTNACDPAPNADGNNWNAVGGASINGCGVVALAGGSGLASEDGTIYLLSPEALDEAGSVNAPNLFVVRPGQAPDFVATLEVNNDVVRNAVKDNEVHRYSDFQVTPDGAAAVFSSANALTIFPTAGFFQVYRYGADGGAIDCASCPPSFATPTADTTLPPYGNSLSNDGRVFFTSSEAMVLRDTNQLPDAYEWSGGVVELISTGSSSFDSGLLSVSADGKNVFFFTHDTLSFQDENGNTVKVYSAREKGGYIYDPHPFPCAASDECHGPGTEVAGPPNITTVTPSTVPTRPTSKPCKKGFVKKRGKCVKKKKQTRKSHRARG
jgi:hypothetical protein